MKKRLPFKVSCLEEVQVIFPENPSEDYNFRASFQEKRGQWNKLTKRFEKYLRKEAIGDKNSTMFDAISRELNHLGLNYESFCRDYKKYSKTLSILLFYEEQKS